MATKKQKGPLFLRYAEPIVETLKQLGNSGTAGEVTDRVIERLGMTETEQEETTASGQPKLRNQIGWARFYLAKANYIDASQKGVWTLTEQGQKAKLDPESVYLMFQRIQKTFPRSNRPSSGDSEEDEEIEQPDYKAQFLSLLKALPPSGFERICQRLLRESGFQQVFVTGRTGDGGIDGHGVLEINPLVTFKVLFQCKRFDGKSVEPGHVRDFRGAMQGRADKGLILTTGTFTSGARKEATRDGVPPIELIDGEKLVTMFERIKLGLRPVQTYEVDLMFFDEFRG